MVDQGVFKTNVFGGFDKQSVLTYVDDMIAQSQAREEELQKKVDKLTNEREQLNQELSAMRSKAEALEHGMDECGRIGQRLEESRARVRELENQLQKERAKNISLQSVVNENEERGHQYELNAARVGAVLVEAQKQADEIIDRARRDAEHLAQLSMDNLYGVNKRVEKFREDINKLRLQATDIVEEFSGQMSQIDQAVKESERLLFISMESVSKEEEPADRVGAGSGVAERE